MTDQIRPVLLEHIQGELESGTSHQIDDTTQLVEEEILDSLGIFSLVSFIEDRFGVEVAPEEVVMENFATLPDIEALVRRTLGSAAGTP